MLERSELTIDGRQIVTTVYRVPGSGGDGPTPQQIREEAERVARGAPPMTTPVPTGPGVIVYAQAD